MLVFPKQIWYSGGNVFSVIQLGGDLTAIAS